jgi:hypothetical protein
MNFIDCKACGAYCVDAALHKCPPMWLVWQPDDGATEDDARKIHARTPAEAAERWAEWDDYNSAEYSIVGGSDATVCVRRADGGEALLFVVSGESVPSYSAKAVV